jgi:hypothetical protein
MKQTVNTKQEYLRNVLDTMKQQMLSSSSSKTMLHLESCPRLESDFPFITSSMPPTPMPMPLTEVIIGVGYVLLILVFLSKVFFKTLNRFTSDYSSSHDGVYNRFAFITNADSDSEFSTDDDDDDTLSDSLSPVQPSIYTPRPPTSPHPPLRRSKRLQMKSEINLTKLEKLEKQTQTQHQKRNSKETFPEVSSDPLPFTKRRTLSFMSPSPHPHHDEELEFEIQRRYEKRSQKRSECNSPLVVRRLIL